jgi:hypothetical protein
MDDGYKDFKSFISGDSLKKSLSNTKGMELMTEDLKKSLPPLYSQENEADPVVRVKYFALCSGRTWYGIEYDPEEELFFGFVHGFDDELGYFSLAELRSLGALIERDKFFEPKRLSDVRKEVRGD